MFRLWGKIFKDNRLIRDCVFESDQEDTEHIKSFRESNIWHMNLIWRNQSGWMEI